MTTEPGRKLPIPPPPARALRVATAKPRHDDKRVRVRLPAALYDALVTEASARHDVSFTDLIRLALTERNQRT